MSQSSIAFFSDRASIADIRRHRSISQSGLRRNGFPTQRGARDCRDADLQFFGNRLERAARGASHRRPKAAVGRDVPSHAMDRALWCGAARHLGA